jgi:tRNA(adenine34) deaminase
MDYLHSDEYFMKIALKNAVKSMENDEVPVGAIIVARNQIISQAHNQVEMLSDVTAHAEILAITAASLHYGSKYLTDCTLYVTLEPCAMCAGAIKWAQIGRLVWAASDANNGFMRYGKDMLHPATKLAMGVCEEEARELLQQFFKAKRASQL